MGSLKRFNLQRIIDNYGITTFFETGTWRGDGLAYACRHPFKKLLSSEIVPEFARKAEERFAADARVKIIEADSLTALERSLTDLNGHCIFWLDAHFPAADEGLQGFNVVEDESIRLPLEKEMEIIARRKGQYKDVILIDDLRIYEDGDYDQGNLPDNILPPKIRNIDFADRLFGDTHDIYRSNRMEGFMYLLPKGTVSENFLKKIGYALRIALKKGVY